MPLHGDPVCEAWCKVRHWRKDGVEPLECDVNRSGPRISACVPRLPVSVCWVARRGAELSEPVRPVTAVLALTAVSGKDILAFKQRFDEIDLEYVHRVQYSGYVLRA